MPAAKQTEPQEEEVVTISVRTKRACFRDNRRYRERDYLTYTGKLSEKPEWLVPREAPAEDPEFDDE